MSRQARPCGTNKLQVVGCGSIRHDKYDVNERDHSHTILIKTYSITCRKSQNRHGAESGRHHAHPRNCKVRYWRLVVHPFVLPSSGNTADDIQGYINFCC